MPNWKEASSTAGAHKWRILPIALVLLALSLAAFAADAPVEPAQWPPALPGAVNGTVTIKTDEFLKVPEDVEKARAKEGAAPFIMAKTAPTVELSYHDKLPNAALNGTGWSTWGDICVASDGMVYTGTGNHGENVVAESSAAPDKRGYAFIYRWDPKTKTQKQVVDVNAVVQPQAGDPAWSKVHARILEGRDKKIYFSCTLNDGGESYKMKWTPRVPGGQVFQFDPATGMTQIVGHFPGECTATTMMDTKRNIMYFCAEGKTKHDDVALTAYDLDKNAIVYQSEHDAVKADRNFMLARDGRVFYNGLDGLWMYDPEKKQVSQTKSKFPDKSTLRSSTDESDKGFIYGTTMSPGQLLRYSPKQDKLEMLGFDFLNGEYTTVTVLSPDQKYVYYLPGAHGGAMDIGTPVVQYDIAKNQRKVIAFLREGVDKATGYIPAGTYGIKMSADGSTLYVDFNGQPHDNIKGHGKAFGMTAFAAIHIPASER